MTVIKVTSSSLVGVSDPHITYYGTGVPSGQINPASVPVGTRWVRADPPLGGPSLYVVVFDSPDNIWEAVA